jgi:hypothetical protein
MARVVAFLQNAWSPEYAGRIWPRDLWLDALHQSRSGQRLRQLTGAATGVTFWFDNVTPHVGDNPDSLLPPDPKHVLAVLAEQKPDYVVALGQQAARAVRPLCKVPLLIVPHPTYRVVTNELLRHAGKLLAEGFVGIKLLRQGRGLVESR